jgi:hypothetical protein
MKKKKQQQYLQKKIKTKYQIFTFFFIPEMKFLEISLTKDTSLLLHAIQNPFYWQILKKTILYTGFNNPYKKIYKTRKLESIHECRMEKGG